MNSSLALHCRNYQLSSTIARARNNKEVPQQSPPRSLSVPTNLTDVAKKCIEAMEESITASPISTMDFHICVNEGLTSLKQKGNNSLAEGRLLLPQQHTRGGSNSNSDNSQVLLLAPLSQSQQQLNQQHHYFSARKSVAAAISRPASTSSTGPPPPTTTTTTTTTTATTTTATATATFPTFKKRSSLKKNSSYGNIYKSSINSDQSPSTPTATPPSASSHNSFPSSLSVVKRNVSFGTMQIRQYNVTISDNPSCSHGPPIQLSWEYDKGKEIIVSVESYEESRTTDGDNPRREHDQLLLSFHERHFLLIKQGRCSKREIKRTMKEVKRVKRERMVTDLFLPASLLDETMENIISTVKIFFAAAQ
ncbi:hypothetical protein FRACYDRAFT_263937 [Fragilariopsis cylindrus CCMP1102]|uniref:Uncharacterized protein n=1 Tax=Fragilariopsis cylindrus CCMP1102 TaxID=635003 RepID=A0A1E7EW30_9STRA|nr:hypothetical protein FRACYDRAFT_263937 [Fragilariopsis cylindrus CCMP1102]|eukprot:OEU10049.1 hypothetical protein FRACYDRAFT_263937 [Fragilariopsis cylindrus CCMP1102]